MAYSPDYGEAKRVGHLILDVLVAQATDEDNEVPIDLLMADLEAASPQWADVAEIAFVLLDVCATRLSELTGHSLEVVYAELREKVDTLGTGSAT